MSKSNENLKVNTRPIRIDIETDEMVEKCKAKLIQRNPEYRKTYISKNKMVYELADFYLNHKCHGRLFMQD